MKKRRASVRVALWCSIVLSAALVMSTAFLGASDAATSHRPDAWIKLCGPRNTCLDAPWHPWHGDNVYNTSGRRQRISAGVEEGNMIRFWILLQNDGTLGDTLRVKGCSGSAAFPLLAANRGPWRYTTNKAGITSALEAGNASFTFPSRSTDKDVIITLRFLARTSSRGVSYSCPVTVRSAAHPALKDTVVARMTTI